VRIASFNIHHGTVAKDGPVDPAQLGVVCAGFEADVIALQEVDLGTYRTHRADLASAVADACGMEHVFGPSRRFPGGWYGNALLVRGRIHSWAVERLPRVPSWRVWQEPRSAIEATVEVDGVLLSVTATHLAVPRPVSTIQLGQLLERARTRAPGVILGDLNLRPSVVRPMADAAGLTLVPHGPTNPAPDPVRSIDHALLTPGVVATDADVRITPMSDHCALIVDIDVGQRHPVDAVRGDGR
jgi:endonuclease/exonuclease/phosphatase family metal-dependent hydrolase